MKYLTTTALLAILTALFPRAAARNYLATNVDCGDSLTCTADCLNGAYRIITDPNSGTSFFGCTMNGLITNPYDVSRCIFVGGTQATEDAVEAAACAAVGGRLCGKSTKSTTLYCLYMEAQEDNYNTACISAINGVSGRLGQSVLKQQAVTYAEAFDYADCID